MIFANVKKSTIPEGVATKIASNGSILWKSAPKNWVRYSTEADGVTIFNGGLGYKDGYRVRSGGALAAESSSSCTGFIPFKKGDTLRSYPCFNGLNTNNTINFADSSLTNLGQVTDQGSGYGICGSTAAVAIYKSKLIDGISTWIYDDTFDSRIAYVRITNDIGSKYSPIKSGKEMIITINEEIT